MVKNIFYFLVLFLLVFTACQKEVAIELPEDVLVSPSVELSDNVLLSYSSFSNGGFVGPQTVLIEITKDGRFLKYHDGVPYLNEFEVFLTSEELSDLNSFIDSKEYVVETHSVNPSSELLVNDNAKTVRVVYDYEGTELFIGDLFGKYGVKLLDLWEESKLNNSE